MRPATEPPGLRVDEPNLATTRFLRPKRNGNNQATTRFEPSRPLGSIGEYDLVQQLGRCVFVGHHRVTRQPFAIRVLEPAPGGRRDRAERQLAVARALAAIDHPNVVRTIEVGLYEGRVYLVMEYLRGKTLESALELHGALPVSQAIRIGMHVARGLEAAHLRGIVHRNIDAGTVILEPSERGRSTVKLADFEIEPGDDVVRIARHSMSPELCRGGAIDHRTDLYSLGVLLHRVCTLKYPFEGTPIEILAMYRFRSVVRPPPALAGVPADLASTIQRCLSEDPADRPATAGEVLESLRRAADGLKRRDRNRPEAAERARATPSAEPSVTSDPLDPVLLELEQLPTDEWAGGASGKPVPAPAAPVAAAPAPVRVAAAPAPVPARFAAEAAPTLLEKPAPRSVAKAASGPAALAQTMLAAPAAPAAAKTVVAAGPAALAQTMLAAPAPAAAKTVIAAPVPAGPPAAAPAVLGAPAPAIALKVPVPAAMLAAASARSVPPQAAPEPIDPVGDSSGVLIAPSGPAHVAIALPLDAAAAMPAPPRAIPPFRVPWKPVAVLVAAITAGSVLSLWTTRGGSDGEAASSAASATPAPASPATPAPAAAAQPAASPPLQVPTCAPGTPALVPDVVLSAGVPQPAAPAEPAEIRDEAPRKPPRRKSRPRIRPDEEPSAGESPSSGETIDVSEDRPRRRVRELQRESQIDL